MIDHGHGSPLVLVPGIQGRWEWMLPTIKALETRHRVISFSLHEARAQGAEPRFDDWVDHIDRVLDRASVRRAAIVGVSFGGVIAARYAARRADRASGLILVCSPSPRWEPDRRLSGYMARPLLSAPAFAIGAVRRLLPEVIAARPTWPRRLAFLARHLARVARYPASPTRMAASVRRWKSVDVAADSAQIAAPTLLITGEPSLDRVVAHDSSLEYLRLIPHARHVTLPHTGHVGLVTRPHEFAALVDAFLDVPAADVAALRTAHAT
jgi:pimeloyl-ACP methyl ester carboxylesterase